MAVNLFGGQGQNPPDATAGTAVADGHQFVIRADIQGHGIESVPPDHLHQSGFPAFLNMVQRFAFRDRPSQARVDPAGGLAEEEAAEIDRIVPAVTTGPAEAPVHDKPLFRLPDKMRDNLGWQDDIVGLRNRLIDCYHTIDRQVDDMIAPKQEPVDKVLDQREF